LIASALLFQFRGSSFGIVQRLLASLACALFIVHVGAMERVAGQQVQDIAAQDVAVHDIEAVRRFLTKYCQDCHQGENADAKFDITEYYDARVISERLEGWEFALSRIEQGDMPPAEAGNKPSVDEVTWLVGWSRAFRRSEAERKRWDPGPTSMRRLTHAEYNHSIRDLTGVAIDPALSFPIDPANEAGFDNSARTLVLSPALVGKYLDGARQVASHLILQTDGIRFAPYPVVSETDRDKFYVQRIVDFYRRQPTELWRYFFALSKIEVRIGEGDSLDLACVGVADSEGLSSKYLRMIAERVLGLGSGNYLVGPWAQVREQYKGTISQELDEDRRRGACEALAQWIAEVRGPMSPQRSMMRGPKDLHQGTQSLILWYNRQLADDRLACREDLFDSVQRGLLVGEDAERIDGNIDAMREAYRDFCSVVPNAFYVAERGRPYAREEKQEAAGRLLSAGFHSMMGYYRDDRPLMELVLDEQGVDELNRLWGEFEYVCELPVRQFSGFLWFERAESRYLWDERFDFVRAEDLSFVEPEAFARLEKVYLEKLLEGAPDPQVEIAVREYFRGMRARLDRHLELRNEAQRRHIADLVQFAQRAYRRPLSESQRLSIEKDYEGFREIGGGEHRSAVEDTLVSILTSPWFLFRWDLQTGENGSEVQALTGLELASRLSYALWGSLPDERLVQAGIEGALERDREISEQIHRMVEDPRMKGMLGEFLGSWLEFRRFTEHQGVDREEFVSYDDPLQRAMAAEPIEFFWGLVRNGGALRECLDARYVVVNSRLASHYGLSQIDLFSSDPSQWHRIALQEGSPWGGFATMGVFLTSNSPGLRTSPVKRGYWMIRRLVGERIPAPPPDVPELPKSEKDSGGESLRELLAKHREHPSCAVCHQRFDFAGLMLEGFDPIGRVRREDLAGREIDARAALPDGREAEGVQALKRYLVEERYDDFRLHFCRSLAAFLLNRTLVVSDDLLIEEMIAQMDKNQQRVLVAIEVVCTSTQFRNKRGVQGQ